MAVFPTVFADIQAAFLQKQKSIVHNMIVYRDIEIYCNNVKTLHFLKKLRSTSAMPGLRLAGHKNKCIKE